MNVNPQKREVNENMKLLRNRIVIGILCIAVAITLSFAVLPAIQGTNGGITTTAVRMKQTVQAGARITADMLEAVIVPVTLVQGTVDSADVAAGKYANTTLYAGDYISVQKLSASSEAESALAAGTVKGRKVISVTLPSLAAGVSGRLLPGDIVTVIAIPKGVADRSLNIQLETAGQEEMASIDSELHYVEVCMVTANDGADSQVSGNPDKDEKNTLPTTVSFYVAETQALKLAELEQRSEIHLAFVARGKDAAKFIPDDQRVWNTEVN
jgi:pilus assembly protein CpaB